MVSHMTALSPTEWFAMMQLYAEYDAVVDAAHWERWVQLFTDDCIYRVQPRENFDRGLPLATLSLEGKGMLLDRVFGIRETLFHDPYYQRHVTGPPLVTKVTAEAIELSVNYSVFRTKLSQPTTVFNVGRTIDVVVNTANGLRFSRREFIYDSELIPNSMIYPI